MYQGVSHFWVFLHYFVLAKLATSCVRVKGDNPNNDQGITPTRKLHLYWLNDRQRDRCQIRPYVLLLGKRLDRFCTIITLPMLRLPSSKAQGHKDFWKPSKPCLVGIHWKALAEYSQMSTHVPGFQSFFQVFSIILYWLNLPPNQAICSTPVWTQILRDHNIP